MRFSFRQIFLIQFFIQFIFSAGIFASEPLKTVDLNNSTPSWQTVIGGEAVAPVAETSYGFAVVSDGRMVSTCTSRGNVMWQKNVKGKPSPFFTSWGDFLYTVSNRTCLNFVNPSGLTVWSKDCGFEIINSPVTGWDGRVFVKGQENISCYGLKGTRKWNLKVPVLNSLQLVEFSDGTFLVFLQETKEGKTRGLRISPFGEIREDITFTGSILFAAACDQGILLSFTDGSFGLCSIENNQVISKWIQNEFKSFYGMSLIIPDSNSSAFFFNGHNRVLVLMINNEDGSLSKKFEIPFINLNLLKYQKKTNRGFFVSDDSKAIEFDKDGTVFWEAKLPQQSKWNYISYTNSNQILLCMKDWTLNSYVMSQSIGEQSKIIEKPSKSYVQPSNSCLKIDGIIYTAPTEDRINEMIKAFTNGDYGAAEKDMLSELQEIAVSYREELSNLTGNSRPKNRFFTSNPVYTSSILTALSLTETDLFCDDLALIISLETYPMLLNSLLLAAATTGYDKNGLLLKAFDNISISQLIKKDTVSAKMICDGIYKIVAFMGRPALYRQGKVILSRFFYPQYKKEIRDYSRETLTKIVSLEL